MNFTSASWNIAETAQLSATSSYEEGTKPVAIRNINWVADFACKTNAGAVPKDTTQVTLNDATGTSMSDNITIRTRVKDVPNIYEIGQIPCEQFAHKKGTQINLKFVERYHAVNSVSGDEGDLPLTASITFTVPTHSSITPDLVEAFLRDAIGALYETDTLNSRISDIVRGHLTPLDLR